MATARIQKKPGFFLLFPWSLFSIILILVLNTLLADWFGKNWSWMSLLLIIPPAVFENFKVGYSTIQVMFLKMFYALLSFMLVGFAFGISGAGWYYERFQDYAGIPRIDIPWYVLLSLIIILIIEVAHIFSMLKAVRREFMQFDEG